MGSFFKILLKVFRFIRFVALGYALYGWFWLPRFQNGVASGPHWLLYLYDRGVPLLFGIGVVSLILLFVYNTFIAIIPGQKPSPMAGSFRGIFLWILFIAILGGLPSLVAQFEHMQEVSFADVNYHLIERRTGDNMSEYFVYKCSDPVGLWCQRVAVTNDFPTAPPTPTPFPTPEIVEGAEETTAVLDVPIFPTVTPAAQFITDTMGIELSLQIGTLRLPLTTTMTITDPLLLPVQGNE
jgi:hypothetical protein